MNSLSRAVAEPGRRVEKPTTFVSGAPRLASEAASADIHLLSYIDSTDRSLSPFGVYDIKLFEEARKRGDSNFTGDVIIDRVSYARGGKHGAAATVPADAAVAQHGAPCLGERVRQLIRASGPVRLFKRFSEAVQRTVGGRQFAQDQKERRIAEVIDRYASTMAEPSWSGRRTYEIAASSTPAIDSHMSSSAPVGGGDYSEAVCNFLASKMRAYPQGTTILHDLGHGHADYYSAGMPFDKYVKTLRETTTAAGRPVDLLLHESCLQGNWEALDAMYPYVRYAVVSETVISPLAMGTLLENVVESVEGSPVTPRVLGRSFIEHARTLEVDGNLARTLALVDMSAIPALSEAINRLGGVLRDEVVAGRARALSAVARGTTRVVSKDNWDQSLGDLRSFVERLQKLYDGMPVDVPGRWWSFPNRTYPAAVRSPRAGEVRACIQNVLQALEHAVVDSHARKDYKQLSGISIHVPTPLAKVLQSAVPPSDENRTPSEWTRFVAELGERM